MTEFSEKLKTIQFSPTKSPQTVMEEGWNKDRPAYLRMRSEGLQPAAIKGSAELEQRADSKLEVEMDTVFTDLKEQTGMSSKQLLPRITEGMEATRDMDWGPLDSVESVKDKYHR